MRHLSNIFWLGTKELRSFFKDVALLILVIWAFSLSVYSQAQDAVQELRNASVAIVDEDHSPLARAIREALLPPYFKPPQLIPVGDVDRSMDRGAYTFIIDIPPNFQRDAAAGRRPALQVNVDATAAMQAGIGAGYIERIAGREVARVLGRRDSVDTVPVTLAVRILFNPNVTTSWFTSVMAIINNVTMLAIILAGAALIREREHGTMDHLMVMPLTPFDIAMAKIWANGLVITVATGLSLVVVVRMLLGIPIAGSVPLFLAGALLYLFFSTAIGIFLGTIARSMPQLGLLYLLTALPMLLLSGANTPLESMPPILQTIMQASPSTHFVSFAQAILYRGAGFDVVWPQFAVVFGIGGLVLIAALLRFRKVTAAAIG